MWQGGPHYFSQPRLPVRGAGDAACEGVPRGASAGSLEHGSGVLECFATVCDAFEVILGGEGMGWSF